MAKSLRSKFKRKMRAIKRKRVGLRDVQRLKATIAILNCTIKQEEKESPFESSVDDVEKLECDGTKSNLNAVKQSKGRYPIWLSQRKIRAVSKRKKHTLKMKMRKNARTR